MASHIITLYRVDPTWSENHLLPLFDWTIDSAEARAVWEGFLWTPRLYWPLLIVLKAQFLDTVNHYVALQKHAQQFAAFLTYVALDPVSPYTTKDFQTAFGILPQQGLEKSAQALVQAIEGAGEQREDYWTTRIQPFWQSIWPKSRQLVSKSIAENLARLSIAARGQFPEALAAVSDWLKPIEHPHSIVHLLNGSGLSEQFPDDALRLLNAIINNQPWVPKDLEPCLTSISDVKPSLVKDPRYQRLVQYSQRRGI